MDRLLAPHRRPHVVGDVNIHEVCERVRSLILAEFPKGLRVVRDYDTSIPEFRGDREQLIQAVLNIAHNAAQALAERIAAGDAQIIFRTRVARQVTFGKQRYRLALELHVIDNGPGVPDSIKDRIFYPLVSGREGGSGLGLTLAQTFVQQHHGLIECDSVPGCTDFKIPDSAALTPQPSPSAALTRREDKHMKPIWIVDDDQSIRFVLEKALLRENLPTRSFTNPREVLKALTDRPRAKARRSWSATSACRAAPAWTCWTRSRKSYPGLPVIIMTAFSDLDSAVSAFQGGAFEYLPKPFDLPKAVELIRRAVEESQREEVAEERMAAAPEMLGQAPAMQDVFRAIGRLSQSKVTVLITGESGSGKELVARALHKHSPRAERPVRGHQHRGDSRRTCWSPSCSATSAVPSPARRPCAAAASSRPMAARCFSTKSATCRSTCRPACCACCPTATSTASAATARSRPMCA